MLDLFLENRLSWMIQIILRVARGAFLNAGCLPEIIRVILKLSYQNIFDTIDSPAQSANWRTDDKRYLDMDLGSRDPDRHSHLDRRIYPAHGPNPAAQKLGTAR
jgi:hypothetical protein